MDRIQRNISSIPFFFLGKDIYTRPDWYDEPGVLEHLLEMRGQKWYGYGAEEHVICQPVDKDWMNQDFSFCVSREEAPGDPDKVHIVCFDANNPGVHALYNLPLVVMLRDADSGLTTLGDINTPIAWYDRPSYIIIQDDVNNFWISPKICPVGRMVDDIVKIEWWSDDNQPVGDGRIIPYAEKIDGWARKLRHQVFARTTIAMPTYEYEEEVDGRDGYQFPIKQVSSKVYHFNFRATEEICDVLQFAQLADHVEITAGGVVYNVTKILITPEWLGHGYLANVEVEFETNTVVKRLARAYDING